MLAVLAVVAIAALAVLFVTAEEPARAVGFAHFAVSDPGDKPIEVGMWYPTNSRPAWRVVGLAAEKVATDGNVAGRNLPLILISHGNGGMFSSHSDTALALGSAGFVVAALTHTGDNARDDTYVGTTRWLTDRTRHVRVVLDYLLDRWPPRAQLQPAHVGIFGFSAGAFTALVSVGGVPDLARIGSHCRTAAEFACSLWKQLPGESTPATAWVHDARIKAAVLAAPGYGFAFEPHGLANVTTAVQLWSGSDDRNVPYESNTGIVRRLLPIAPEYHDVPGAGHFAFLAPCPGWLLPAICRDADGFDRRAFHRNFNAAVVAFYRRQFGLQ